MVEAAREEYRRLDYMRWLRFYVFYNWSHGSAHCDRDRQHPMLCGYERLTPEQKKETPLGNCWVQYPRNLKLMGPFESRPKNVGDSLK